MRRAVLAAAAAALWAWPAAWAAVFPSLGAAEFKVGDAVPLYVNRAFSEHVPLPFAYYDLPFVCRPQTVQRPWLNIGEVLRGDRIASSEYRLEMGRNSSCQVLCTKTLDAAAGREAKRFAEQDYRVEWLVDGLPSATVYRRAGGKSYEPGFRIGDYDQAADRAFLNNHVDLHVLYERRGAGRRIVGFEAYPRSLAGGAAACAEPERAARLAVGAGRGAQAVTYTYSVRWIEDGGVTWARRWERYLPAGNAPVHWYAIFNAAVIIVLLSAVVAVILMRMLSRDLALDEEALEALEETSGWKLLHGDVFRAPRAGGLLAPLLGTTVQVLYTAIATVALGTAGALSPSHRGGLLTAGIALFMVTGCVAGYYSGHLYRTWGGGNWFKNALMTAVVVPAPAMAAELVLNVFLWYRASSAAMPFSTILLLAVLWAAVELPLTVAGAWVGFRRRPYSEPVRTNAIPRPVPPQPRYLRGAAGVLLAGALPFAVAFVELHFVFRSIWQDAFYYQYGFAVLAGLLLALAVCETTVIMVWLSLNAGQHRWWWRSFAYGASSAVYIFGYSLLFYATRLRGGMPGAAGLVPTLTFFVHSLLIAAAYALCTGSMGFFAAYFFIRRIYSMNKLS
ncbi:hypothetical protein H4R18_003485 [Coemansia javaensis]|uniref:Transmembrane 9 superfamily member n=1 Tax=Coemansia javaensis TaxID=2761396 RepID=A0A9W8LII9_9FUNG|nr:hypothetical protein H4R18_003485 [Coemansia javaensis]